MFSRLTWGTLTLLLLPVGVFAQPADGRYGAYPGGPDMMSWISDASRTDVRTNPYYRGNMAARDFEGGAYRYPYKRYPFSYQAYATSPAFWGPGYAYPYGYASSWYPYTSWRGLGNEDNAFPNYDYNAYSPIPSIYGAAPLEAAYRAAPYTAAATSTGLPYTAPANARASFEAGVSSRISVSVPAGAEIYLQDVRMASGVGEVRTFQTPPLEPDQQYRYRIRAVWTRPDGQTVDQTQEVAFLAGADVTARFPTAPTARQSLETRSMETR